jgi:hypothetical protein
MSRDLTLTALRDASPRRQPEFTESPASYHALRDRIIATPVPADRPAPRVVSRRLIGLSVVAAAVGVLACVAVVLTLSASSPASALAAARRALDATFAATSGTMTVTTVQGGATTTLETTRWHGSDVALSATSGALGPNRQLLLIGGGAYVQRADGRWLHYADETKIGQLGVAVQLARANVAGNGAQQVLALANDVKRTHTDGGTVYTGTIPTSNPVRIANNPADDAILRLVNRLRGDGNPPVSPNPFDRHPARYDAVQLTMTVAGDGLVNSISLTVQPTTGTSGHQPPASTFGVTYSQLGDTPPITPPATSTPTPSVIVSPAPVCPPPPHGPCGG